MATKSTIVFKSVGQNVKLVIDGETHSRKIQDKEEREILKSRVVAYNAKPLVKEKKSIISFMAEDKVKAKTSKANEVKATKVKRPAKEVEQIVEAKPELTMEEQLANARKLLEDNNFTVHAKQTTPSPYKRRGEY